MTDNLKKTLKWAGWGLLGFVVLLVLGFVVSFLLIFRTYSSVKDKFRISYPSSWQVVPHSEPQALVAFVSPKENSLDIFRDNVAITFTDISATPMTLAQYVKASSEQMTTFLSNVKLLESTSAIVAGRSAWRMVFFAEGKPSSVIAVYVYLKGSNAYNITYMGTAERYFKMDRWIFMFMATSMKDIF